MYLQRHKPAASFFAEQHCTVGNSFCPDQCCSALLVACYTPVQGADCHGCICSNTSLLRVFLQRSTEHWGNHCAKFSAAVHWEFGTAHLHEEQISIGVFALTQACCEPYFQSSSQQWGTHCANTSAALHWSCVTAYLCEEQNPQV